jgi:hypothetical protein
VRHRGMGRCARLGAAVALTVSTAGCGADQGVEAADGAATPLPASPSVPVEEASTPDEEEPVGTVLEVLEADGRFTEFVRLFPDPGLLASPSFDTTLFVPSDDAFAALGEEVVAGLRADPQRQLELARQHVTGAVPGGGRVPSATSRFQPMVAAGVVWAQLADRIVAFSNTRCGLFHFARAPETRLA